MLLASIFYKDGLFKKILPHSQIEYLHLCWHPQNCYTNIFALAVAARISMSWSCFSWKINYFPAAAQNPGLPGS